MAKFKIRYFRERKQKGGHSLYYWVPTQKMQKAGFLTRRLPDSLAEAIEVAEQYNKEWDHYRTCGVASSERHGTVAWLIREYKNDRIFTDLAVKTQKDYDHHLRKIEKWAGNFDYNSITRKVARVYYEEVLPSGVRNAQARIKVARRLFSYAVNEDMLSTNPFTEMRIKSPKPRKQVWESNNTEALLKVARETVRKAVIMAEYTGQRPADILHAHIDQYDGERLAVVQEKTGAHVSILCLPELKEVLDNPDGEYFILNPETRRPYTVKNFSRHFAADRNKAGVDVGLQFRDFRRTAVVNLARVGCTVPEIASITGHSIKACQHILDVYFPKDTPSGDNAMRKLKKLKAEKKKS